MHRKNSLGETKHQISKRTYKGIIAHLTNLEERYSELENRLNAHVAAHISAELEDPPEDDET